MELLLSLTIVPLLLPFIVYIIFLFLPEKKTKKIKPVETDEIFDHLFIEKKQMVRINWQMGKAA